MTDQDYEQQIRTYGWPQLHKLWQAIGAKDTPGWGTGKAFEYLIVRAFELSGAKVRYPYSVSEDSQILEQIDGVIYYQHLSCLLECKDQTDPINFEPIAKLRSQLMRRPTTIGNVFSMSGFTKPALKLMRTSSPQIILLWYPEEIEQCLDRKNIIEEALLLKYRYYVEICKSDFNITSLKI